MTYKKYLIATLLFTGIIVILSLITTILYHNDIINSKIVKVVELITLFISSVVSGLYIGLKSINKGYINGLILGGIITAILLLLNVIITRNITIISILIYLIMIVIITSSSILGINKRK